MLYKLVQKGRFLAVALALIVVSIAGFHFLIIQQEEILHKYFIDSPQEELKQFHTSLSNSLSKYFVRENRAASLKDVEEYIKRYGKTSLYELFFIFQDKDGGMKQISKVGTTTLTHEVLSSGNVYPVTIDSGNMEGYLMVLIRQNDSAELREGLVKYKIISYSLRLIFLLLVTALLVIIFYHDYSAKMKLARDMAEIKASYDGLTGLHTHEYFMKVLEIEVEKANIYNAPLALIMMDIDYFKKFNDTYGHLAGDKVLQEVSNIIKVSTRATDVLARYGGEEFAIIIPYVAKPGDIPDARRLDNFLNEINSLAERVRKNVEDATTPFSAEVLKVTVSIGVAFYYKKSYEMTSTMLLEKADTALYQAKRLGRNRIYIDYGYLRS